MASSSSHGADPDYAPTTEQATQDNSENEEASDNSSDPKPRVLKNTKDRKWTLEKLLKKFRDCLPSFNVVEIDDPLVRNKDSMVVYGGQIKLGMPLPFPRFAVELLNYLDLAPQQLGVQSWSTVACIWALKKRLGVEIPLEWFFAKYEVRITKAGHWGVPMVYFTHAKNLEKITFGKFAESKSFWPNYLVRLTPKMGFSFIKLKSDGEPILQRTFPLGWKDIRKSKTKFEIGDAQQVIVDSTDVKLLGKVEENSANESTSNIYWRHLLPKYAGSYGEPQALTAPSYSECTRANRRFPELVAKEKEEKASKRAATEAAPSTSSQGAKRKIPSRPKAKVTIKRPRKSQAKKPLPFVDLDGTPGPAEEIAKGMGQGTTHDDPAAITIAVRLLSDVPLSDNQDDQDSEDQDSEYIGNDVGEDLGSDSVISGGDSPIADVDFCFNWINIGDPNVRADLAAQGSPPRVKKRQGSRKEASEGSCHTFSKYVRCAFRGEHDEGYSP